MLSWLHSTLEIDFKLYLSNVPCYLAHKFASVKGSIKKFTYQGHIQKPIG